ncbi:MAG: LEA type 2 family protein [Flavobacteriales bacterium]
MESCRVYRDVEFKGVKDTRFTSFDMKGISCEFDVELYNPNLYNITMVESDIVLYMEGTRIGKVQLPSEAVLTHEASTTLKLSCTAETSSIPKLLGGAVGLVFKKDIVIQGKGSVTAKAFLISKTIPVSFEERIRKEDLGL